MALNPFGTRPRSDPAQVAAIKDWTRAAFHLPVDTAVLVTELQCTEEGCPPLETVIAILDTPGIPRQYKVYKPLREVTGADINALAARPSGPPQQHT